MQRQWSVYFPDRTPFLRVIKPETAIVSNGAGPPDIAGGIASASMPGTLVNTAAGTAGSLAGWAFSSIGGMVCAVLHGHHTSLICL